MKIRRVEVSNFKKLIGPVLIDGIGDGITVIAGDNEEGKSTLLQAMRAVLFDRHNLTGEAAEAMLPFGHRVRPEIGLHFEQDDFKYQLRRDIIKRRALSSLPQPVHSPQRTPKKGSRNYSSFGRRRKVRESRTAITVSSECFGSNRAAPSGNWI